MNQTQTAACPKGPCKRNRYFIKKKFQAGVILKFSLIVLAGILVSTILLFSLSQDSLTSCYAHSRLEIKSTGQAILPAVLVTNLVTLGLICLFSMAVMLFISHKIAGPLFRFEKGIKEVAQGDLRVKVNLRKKDQLSDISTALNQMTSSIHEKISHIDARLSQIEGMDNGRMGEEIAALKSDIRNQFKLNN